jgi:hypothetical protein
MHALLDGQSAADGENSRRSEFFVLLDDYVHGRPELVVRLCVIRACAAL